MRSSKIVTTEEAIAICDGRMTAFYELPKYQPIVSEDGYVYCGNFADRYKNDMQHEDWRIQFAKDYSLYPLNTPIYLREKMFEAGNYYTGSFDESGEYETRFFSHGKFVPFLPEHKEMKGRIISAASMPKRYARTWIEITEVKCVRVQEVDTDDLRALGCSETLGYAPIWYEHRKEKHIAKYGQSSWDTNPFIFLYNFKLVKK